MGGREDGREKMEGEKETMKRGHQTILHREIHARCICGQK